MAAKKAEVVSLASVARSVEGAVKIAAARHGLTVDKDTLLNRWEIIGRRLRDVADLNLAIKFASDVTLAVKQPGMKVVPVVSIIGKDILVGFIDKANAPKLINR